MTLVLNRLTVAEIRRATAGDMLPDGGGLYFSATGPGMGSWEWRYYRFGTQRWMGLGSYQDVSLAQAREDRLAWRQVLKSGKDPIQVRKDQKLAVQKAEQSRKTFREVFEEWVTARTGARVWKSAEKTSNTKRKQLERHAYLVIGSTFVDQIETAMVLRILEPLWKAKKIATASMVCHDIKDVLDYATFMGYRRGDNPAKWEGHIDQVAHKADEVQHFASIDYRELPAFMEKLRIRRSMSAEALTFGILTCVRPIEVSAAPWTEFGDYKKTKVWRIPKERMKAERDHVIPLSEPAIAILEKMERIAEGKYVYPGRQGRGHMHPTTLNALLDRMDLHGLATPHGFRSTFRSWGSAQWEKLSKAQKEYRMYLLEVCLAHKIVAAETIGADPALLAAYDRDELVEQRRSIMDAWAKFVMTPPSTNEQSNEDELAEAAE
jgi:integrase